MAKVARLIREARAAATARGHTMSKFSHLFDGVPMSDQAEAVCLVCGRAAIVHAHPPPNGIEIHGEAVAMNCGTPKEDYSPYYMIGRGAA